MVRGLNFLIVIIALVLSGCGGNGCDLADDPPPDPVALLTEAADNIRAAETFRLEITHSGAEYLFSAPLTEDATVSMRVAFRRALAQYVADEEFGAQVSVLSNIIGRVDLDIYAHGYEQWFRLASSPFWFHRQFAPGFNPRTLIAEDSGFQAALASLENLEYVGTETLEDGTGVYHLAGTADGPDITVLLVGMIEAEADVDVDVYINCEVYPVRLVIRQPETITEDDPVPTTWTVDVYDINEEPNLNKPEDS